MTITFANKSFTVLDKMKTTRYKIVKPGVTYVFL